MSWVGSTVWEYAKGVAFAELLGLLRISLPPILVAVILWI